MIPTTAASTGQSFSPDAMRAELRLTTSSLLLTRRGSLRVATTVPTIFARSIGDQARFGVLGLYRCVGLSDRQRVFEVGVRPRDHVHRDQLADAPASVAAFTAATSPRTIAVT